MAEEQKEDELWTVVKKKEKTKKEKRKTPRSNRQGIQKSREDNSGGQRKRRNRRDRRNKDRGGDRETARNNTSLPATEPIGPPEKKVEAVIGTGLTTTTTTKAKVQRPTFAAGNQWNQKPKIGGSANNTNTRQQTVISPRNTNVSATTTVAPPVSTVNDSFFSPPSNPLPPNLPVESEQPPTILLEPSAADTIMSSVTENMATVTSTTSYMTQVISLSNNQQATMNNTERPVSKPPSRPASVSSETTPTIGLQESSNSTYASRTIKSGNKNNSSKIGDTMASTISPQKQQPIAPPTKTKKTQTYASKISGGAMTYSAMAYSQMASASKSTVNNVLKDYNSGPPPSNNNVMTTTTSKQASNTTTSNKNVAPYKNSVKSPAIDKTKKTATIVNSSVIQAPIASSHAPKHKVLNQYRFSPSRAPPGSPTGFTWIGGAPKDPPKMEPQVLDLGENMLGDKATPLEENQNDNELDEQMDNELENDFEKMDNDNNKQNLDCNNENNNNLNEINDNGGVALLQDNEDNNNSTAAENDSSTILNNEEAETTTATATVADDDSSQEQKQSEGGESNPSNNNNMMMQMQMQQQMMEQQQHWQQYPMNPYLDMNGQPAYAYDQNGQWRPNFYQPYLHVNIPGNLDPMQHQGQFQMMNPYSHPQHIQGTSPAGLVQNPIAPGLNTAAKMFHSNNPNNNASNNNNNNSAGSSNNNNNNNTQQQQQNAGGNTQQQQQQQNQHQQHQQFLHQQHQQHYNNNMFMYQQPMQFLQSQMANRNMSEKKSPKSKNLTHLHARPIIEGGVQPTFIEPTHLPEESQSHVMLSQTPVKLPKLENWEDLFCCPDVFHHYSPVSLISQFLTCNELMNKFLVVSKRINECGKYLPLLENLTVLHSLHTFNLNYHLPSWNKFIFLENETPEHFLSKWSPAGLKHVKLCDKDSFDAIEFNVLIGWLEKSDSIETITLEGDSSSNLGEEQNETENDNLKKLLSRVDCKHLIIENLSPQLNAGVLNALRKNKLTELTVTSEQIQWDLNMINQLPTHLEGLTICRPSFTLYTVAEKLPSYLRRIYIKNIADSNPIENVEVSALFKKVEHVQLDFSSLSAFPEPLDDVTTLVRRLDLFYDEFIVNFKQDHLQQIFKNLPFSLRHLTLSYTSYAGNMLEGWWSFISSRCLQTLEIIEVHNCDDNGVNDLRTMFQCFGGQFINLHQFVFTSDRTTLNVREYLQDIVPQHCEMVVEISTLQN